jgi:hypothetical protein
MFANVTMAFQNAATTGEGLTQFLPDPLNISNMGQFRDACLSATRMFGWDGSAQPSVTYYGDDNRTVVVCDPERRQQLIEQRQRLLEQEATQASGREVEAAVTAALPAAETRSKANVGTGSGTMAQDPSPVTQPDPVWRHMQSIGKAETWIGGQDTDPADPIRADAFPEYDI